MADPVVELQSGWIRGVVEKHEEGFDYYAFRGVPYAEPPLGQLRFKDPVPKKAWTGVTDCKIYGPICSQYDFISDLSSTDEDCLYLNVFTRDVNDMKVKKPVILSVHGGAYMFGSGDDLYYGPDYLIRKNIVLVTFNYRVGVLGSRAGFLNLGEKIAPGNQGFKDQVMVLQWIQRNIRGFGGDPDNVTVYGTYTGSSAAHYLATSPLTKGLFHKVISQGCCAYNPWTFVVDPKSMAIKFCSMLGKELVDSEEILKFLKTIDAKSLLEAQERLRKSVDVFPFGPSIDSASENPFMPVDPVTLMNEGVHLPYLIGYPNRPGLIVLQDEFGFPKLSREESLKLWERNFEHIFSFNSRQTMDRYNLNERQIRRLYYKSEAVSNDNIDNYVNFCSDFHFIEGIHKFLKTQYERSSASTYMYVFDYSGPGSAKEMYIKNVPKGACFGDDPAYLFKRRYKEVRMEFKKGTTRYRIMEQMTEMWANFATYGRPTIDTSELIPVHWKPITNGTVLQYLSIDEDIVMQSCINVDQKLLSAKSIRV